MTLQGPTLGTDRIASIDVLRGVALLGILLLNVRTFAMPGAGYFSPVALGAPSDLDMSVFAVINVAFEAKFMTIFSLLFGVGIVLFTSRLEARTGRSASLHYRRMWWLLVIGLAHAWLIWWGDILVPYALCGMLVWPLRRVWPWLQGVLGLLLLGIGTLVIWGSGYGMQLAPPEAAVETLTMIRPPPEIIAQEDAAWGGSWLDQMPLRAKNAATMETFLFAWYMLWRVTGLMLIGMALFRSGLLSLARSPWVHAIAAVLALGIGLPLAWRTFSLNQGDDWATLDAIFGNTIPNYWGSFLGGLGWMALWLLVCRLVTFTWLNGLLAAVGRMALTNYLLQSILCSVIFYGWGIGLYGRLGYAEQLLVVAVVWTAQIAWSAPWLRAFRFGPAEWAWRSLTYWGLQPMRRRQVPLPA